MNIKSLATEINVKGSNLLSRRSRQRLYALVLSICLSVRPLICIHHNRDFFSSKTKQFRAMVSSDD